MGLPTDSLALPGRIAITTYGNLVDRIVTLFPPDVVITLSPADLSQAAADAVVLIPGLERVDEALLAGLPRLRLIQKAGVGVESIDLAAATRRGIWVANVPSPGTGNAESVAELALLHLLALARHLRVAELNTRQGIWGQPQGASLWGKTVGIYGLGGVGQALARRLRPFEVRLLAIKRQPDAQLAAELGLAWLGTPADRVKLLQESDFLVIAASANQGVAQPFGLEDFQQMRPSAYLVNVARGAWLDERALVQALRCGWLAGAGLDVFEREPLDSQSPLLGADFNLTLTPHLGGRTDSSYAGIARTVAENVRRVARGEAPEYCLNPEVVGGLR